MSPPVPAKKAQSLVPAAPAALKSAPTQHIKPVYSPTYSRCMEQLQEGYVTAVAATAGCSAEIIPRDVYFLDVRFVQPRGADKEEIAIAAQLKSSTTLKPDPTKPTFSYQLKQRDYYVSLAKHRSTTKAILLVMATDPDQSKWTCGSHDALSLVHCCYWVNLEDDTVPAAASPTVHIPTANVFDADALLAMFDRVANGQRI